MLVDCPKCKVSYRITPPRRLPPSGRVRCTACGHVWNPTVRAEIDECEAVNAALHRLEGQTNQWKTIHAVPKVGAIGFALEAALYNHLAHLDDHPPRPAYAAKPDSAVGLCVFHKEFRPREEDNWHIWQLQPDEFPAYPEGDDRNIFVERAEAILHGRPFVMYAHAMELACRRLLRALDYDVRPYKKPGKAQAGIDVISIKHDTADDEEEDGRVLALECKTTQMGFDAKARHDLLSRVLSSREQAHDHENVGKAYGEIKAHHGDFEYLFVTNRDFEKPSSFRQRDGSFILRGVLIE